jgi:hypothetical protein
VSDLYRWWYRQRNLTPNRLLVESFFIMEPYWTLRTGSVPFWMKFNMEASLDYVHQYLDSTDPYDEIYLTLFQHGVDAVGLPSIDEWRTVFGRARTRGGFVGVEEQKYPRDFAAYVRYHEDLRKIPARYPIPGPLAFSQLDAFREQAGDRYLVKWIEHTEGDDELLSIDNWRRPESTAEELRSRRAETGDGTDEPIMSPVLREMQHIEP